ncbi:family 16 glycoside hydrolase [Wenyingzhuangia sp. IMCC45574]
MGITLFLMIGSIQGQTKKRFLETELDSAKLVFQDDFNRDEEDNRKEQLGNGWKTNSKNRANGNKQADLRNHVLYVEMWKDATHGTSILHTAPIDNGVVKVKFKMLSVNKRGNAIEFNFNNPKAKDKTVNGHVCQVAVSPTSIKIEDQYTGRFNPELRKKMKKGVDKKEVKKILATKKKKIAVAYTLNQWYEITIVFRNDTLLVYIDNEYIGKHTSSGFDVKKENIAFSLWSTAAEFDDISVWSLD